MKPKQITLPKEIRYDLEGFRGFGLTFFPLIVEKRGDQFVASYCHDKAGYALGTAWGNTKTEAKQKLAEQLQKEGYL